MEQNQKHYYAFISHSSEDEKTAKWLCKQLEGYHIPAVIQKEYHAPKRLKPIFIYEIDLSKNVLKRALESELIDSQYLIVICSPMAAKSIHVNDEVLHFINSGRYEKIIPFIIDGTPFASLKGDLEDECFPPALVALKGTEQELRGIDLRQEQKDRGSKKAAVIDVIASMLGVRYDELWDRYQHRRRKIQIAVAIGIFLLCLVGLVIWDYTRPTYRYFTDYVDKWGAPEGIIELSNGQQRHRYRMYQFEYRRIPYGEPNALEWRVVTVRYVNNRKVTFPIQHTEYIHRFPIQKIEYNRQTGDVARIIYTDEYGEVQLRQILSNKGNQRAAIVDFINRHEQQGNAFLQSNANNLQNMTMMSLGVNSFISNSAIKRCVYERDQQGHIVAVSYRKNNDDDFSISVTCDADGIYGIKYILDSLGRCIKLTYVDKKGEPVSNRTGIVSKEYTYDQYGNICETKNLDINGKLTFNEQLWARGECYYNEDGNCYLQKYFDISNELSPNVYGRVQDFFLYDTDCNIIESQCLDARGDLCYDKTGVAVLRSMYNKDGRTKKIINLSPQKEPCCDNVTGSAWGIMEYDKYGRPVSVTYYGIDGKKTYIKKGYSSMVISYKENKRTSNTYYDANGEMCLNRELNVARQTFEYDEQDYLKKICNYGTNNELCVVGNGAIECRNNLPNGNPEEVYFLNEQGERFNNINGFNKIRITYNPNGLITEMSYYDKNDKLCMCVDGFAIQRFKYKELDSGMQYSISLYDTLNRPCMHAIQNVSSCVYELNKYSQPVSQYTYDTVGRPCINNQLCAKCENEYDAHGNLIQTKYYQYKDNRYMLAKNIEGVAIQQNKYNERGLWIEAASYDEYNNATYTAYGNSKWQRSYDERGRCIELRNYLDGNMLFKNAEGVAIITFTYNASGDMVGESFLDENRQLCENIYGVAYIVNEYNSFKGVKRISFYDRENKLTMCSHPNFNCAYMEFLYDERGNLISTSKYDEEMEIIN